MNHTAQWTSPEPLWGRFADEPDSVAAFRAEDQAPPAILRFATDDFMEQLLATLAADPRQIGTLIARPETWRSPQADGPDLVQRQPAPRLARVLQRLRLAKVAQASLEPTTHVAVADENGVERSTPLKLFHPAHQRHYLVAANLVCARNGLPDREIASGGCERAAFVLRRLLPAETASAGPPFDEYAFIKDAGGARWQRVGAAGNANDSSATMLPGEELLPLFPLNFRDDSDHPRRILAGVVPVGRREEYMTSRAQREVADESGKGAGIAANPSPVAARKEQFRMEVSEPWKNLIRSCHKARERIMDNSGGKALSDDQKRNAAISANNQLQGQSWLILLDFADFLYQHLRPVWNCMVNPARSDSLSNDGQRRLVDWLNSSATAAVADCPLAADGRPFAGNLRDALQQVRTMVGVRQGLEGATRFFPEKLDHGLAWPGFVYLLAGVRGSGGTYDSWGIHNSLNAVSGITVSAEDQDAVPPALAVRLQLMESEAASLDRLVQLVILAIDLAAPAAAAPPLPFALRLRDALATTQGDPGWFTMRCVYVRCDCGPQQAAVLSPPTRRFQLASFFDPDAPARPIRISLPLDTTAAGMRKHSKNTAFVISDVLCGQIQRAKGLGLGDLIRAVLPWPLHKDLDVGGLGPCQKSPAENIGMICSLSIPIITICALILLMIIVSLLDFIFRWMPWFVMCFPIPGLKAKKGE